GRGRRIRSGPPRLRGRPRHPEPGGPGESRRSAQGADQALRPHAAGEIPAPRLGRLSRRSVQGSDALPPRARTALVSGDPRAETRPELRLCHRRLLGRTAFPPKTNPDPPPMKPHRLSLLALFLAAVPARADHPILSLEDGRPGPVTTMSAL